MILVLASRFDQEARSLVEQWSAYGARLLTPPSLSRRGWRHQVGAADNGRLALGEDETVDASEVRAVYTRLLYLDEAELPQIVASDRAYVASEMTAFLLAWLSEIPCRVVNRPTPTCLAGPYWRPERWILAAAGLGIPVRPIDRQEPGNPPPVWSVDCSAVTVVGERFFGPVDVTIGHHAVRLARLARVDVLQTIFERGRFVGAHLTPDLSRPGVLPALLDCLLAS
jgi:hypothetical protein